jgi:hypothetical protein
MRTARQAGAWAPALLALTLTLAACGASAPSTSAAGAARCANAAEVLAQAAGHVGVQIYDRELASTEVRADERQVQGYEPLLSALAAGDRAQINAAVTHLVFSHTHIVRLRVSQGSTVLADVGGPYIIAPAGGVLRFHGRTVGRYVLSVQDDLGYVKLVTRFIDVPLVLRQGATSIPVEGTLQPGPSHIPDHGAVSYRGQGYQAFSFAGRAFPSGSLRISLLVPVPRSLSASSCEAIRVGELEHISQLVWRRFELDGAPPSAFVDTIASLTSGLSYVRAGSRQVAGSPAHGPRRLPAQGTVRYHGVPYTVVSFTASGASGAVRVYLLVPAALTPSAPTKSTE